MGLTYHIKRCLGFMVKDIYEVNHKILSLYKEHFNTDCDDDYQYMFGKVVQHLYPNLEGDYFHMYDNDDRYISVSVDLRDIIEDRTYYQHECFISCEKLAILTSILKDNEASLRDIAAKLGLPQDIKFGFSYKFIVD